MRLAPFLLLLHSFTAIPSLSQNSGSKALVSRKLESIATFRDRWNANGCHDLLTSDAKLWRKCCVPLISDAAVPETCSSVSVDTAKSSEKASTMDDESGDTIVATDQSTDISLPTSSSSSAPRFTSNAEHSTSTEEFSTSTSGTPDTSDTSETSNTSEAFDASETSAISTFRPAAPTALIANDAATDEGYRAEGGSVTSTTSSTTPSLTQTDSSQTTPPTSYNAPSNTQTVLEPEQTSSPPPPNSTTPAISADVYRHRAQSAVNLGFWFVAEEYGTPEYFKGCATNDTAEINIAEGCTKEYMEDFWKSFITERDFAAMAELGINTVRLPIGYWSVGKENCHCEDTPFWPFIEKYESQWSYVLKAIEWAAKYNIGVLVDYHAAEGSQNGWDHSGIHSKRPTFLDSPVHLTHSTSVLVWIAQQIKDMPNIVGLELLNEPYPDTPKVIDPWYESTMTALKPILGDDFPFYVFGNNANRAAWVKKQTNFVVMDFHLYFLWNARIGKMKTGELISRMSTYYAPLLDSFGPNLIIGEWACTVSNASTTWQDYTEFCDAQLALLNRASVAGWHYWSWKTEGSYNSTWSFLSSTGGPDGMRRAQTNQRELLIPPSGQPDFLINTAMSSGPDQNKVAQKRSTIALEKPDAIEVWDQGCRTAHEFARSGSRLGFTAQWIKNKRIPTSSHSEREYHEHFSRGLEDCQWM